MAERPERSDRDRERPREDGRPASSGGRANARGSSGSSSGAARPRRDGEALRGERPWKRDGDAPRGARPDRAERPRRDGEALRGERPWKRDGDAPRGARPDRAERPRRDGDAPRADRPWQKDRSAKPTGDRPWKKTEGDRPARGVRAGRPERGDRSVRPERGDRPARSVGARQEGIRSRRTDDDERPRHDDPVIPETVTGRELDKSARFELKTLSKENADRVAQHLVMAGTLIEEDAALAHRHAEAAARRAGRVAIVRETLAITAYATGDYALALRELRTYRRLSGSNEQLPLMVDCERGLGRPEKGLELGRSVDRTALSVGTRVELAIAMSGARLDLGQAELALTELEIPQLDPGTAYSFSPALFDAYAVVLAELGRTDEADVWARRADVAAEAIAEAEGEFDDIVEIVEEELAEGGADAR